MKIGVMGRAVRKRLEAMNRLPEMIRRLRAASNGESFLGRMCALVKEGLGADEVAVLLPDPSGREMVEHEAAGDRRRTPRVRLRVREEGIVGWVAAHRLPQLVADVRQDRRYFKVNPATRSEAVLPILEGDRLLGVLDIESRHPGYFQRKDLPVLEFLAVQLGIALRLERREEEVREWKERMGAVQNILRLGGGVVPASVMFQRAVDSVRLTCGGHYAAVFEGDYDRGELVLRAQSSAFPLDLAVGTRIRFRTGLVGKAFELGETVNVRDVRRDPMYVERIPGVLSEVCVPIRVGDRCLGILDAQAQTVGEFTPDEVMFLETIARALAPAFRTPVEV